MFEYQGPVQAATAQRELVEDFSSKLPAEQKTQLRALNAETSPMPLLVGGMEVLYVLALEKPLSTAAGREAVLKTLGTVATAVGVGQYGGPETRDRAWALAAWAAHQLEPGSTEPEAPTVSQQYTTVAPPAVPPAPLP